MRILIVEDEPRIAKFLQGGLTADGHFCVISEDGVSGLSLALEGDFDLVLLDLMLPRMHGHEVCQQLRMSKVTIPVIILTGLNSVDDVIAGLRMGADDYITKPFSFEELRARIAAVMRRNVVKPKEDQMLKCGRLVFDRESLRFTVDGREVNMTAKELAIIELLMSKPGTLFSRERILCNVWGLSMDPLTNVVDVYIGKLRKKIDSDSNNSVIETVRGMGYRLSNA
ncbi:response regulator transcription factor [Pseudomonadota bacterium]